MNNIPLTFTRVHALATLAIVALCGTASLAQPQYQFVPVAPLTAPGGESYLWDINELNQAVGVTSKFNTIGYPAMMWTESGSTTILPTPGWPRGVSNTGWVVGVSQTLHVPSGQIFTPATLPGTYPILNFGGVNDSGIAVGLIYTCSCSNSGGVQQIPLVWSQANGSSTISVPNAKGLSRINSSNRAIGWLNGNVNNEGFFIDLDTGAYTLMDDVFPNIGVGPTRATDINDAGQIVGTRYGELPIDFYGYIYDPVTGVELLPFPSGNYNKAVRPFGINNEGTIVGDIFVNGASRPFVYTNADGIQDLTNPALVQGIPAGYGMITAQKINDNGWIVGYGNGGNLGIVSGFVLKPIGSTACQADCDASGALTIDDFICFQTLFALADPAADCDANGALSIDDFICFQTLFALGC